ncbi:anhydro-N-acetylmuramic acid kinase [Psychrobacter sp. FDAARGOS_221]|uniref:anhydro-N-acetylmuramic acid kinase n=1 Tax=Psychrobacter sp. FDAARGOS_221 TaxID=1975705 RepID=UPI000BB530FE|nr:anhydro-N-acetylmuramic acid kinase [Psychrobacter sp. FDAARGOS_221]PNK60910.1 anhydro-N-acetylmuramic acid kinase [Psychrobacter sp. FDAARGOS_221]
MTQSMTDNDTPTFDDFEQAFSETLFDSFDSGYYIGMMSGTSLDGMDAVICQFDEVQDNKIVATHSKAFPENLRDTLLALCQPNGTNDLAHPVKNTILEQQPHSELEWFGWASCEYAKFASTVVNELLEQSGISAESILAIGCHGQTVRHRPKLNFTLQLVDPNIIAERTGISVVTDFRRRDMAVGGQGAPLAPAFHLAQFGNTASTTTIDESASDKHRIVVNLGGISNITLLPANDAEQVTGYDTGPANILLDAWYQHHVSTIKGDFDNAEFEPLYDKDGQWARSGSVNQALLDQLLAHEYFTLPTPKSTGREDFNLNWLNAQIAELDIEQQQALSPADVQATLTMLTAQTLTDAIKAEAERLDMTQGELVVCGGGAYNGHLLKQIAELLPQWRVLTSQDFGIAPTWVEAMAFAWLARQTIMGETGNLPAVTGASKAVVLGQVCFA